MKKIFVWGCILFLVQAACQVQPVVQTATPAPFPTPTPTEETPVTGPQTYPLSAGAYWLYEGTVAYEQNGEPAEETVQWRVEVLEKVERLNVTGYLVQGALYDLAFYAPGAQPSEYAILQIGKRFYTADLETYDRLNDMGDYLVGLVSDYDLFLELPLETGNRFCDTDQLSRDDMGYCWLVGEPVTSQFGQAFPISLSTTPDFSQFEFVPGVGFIGFMYHHGGSLSEVDVQLIEYSLGAGE